MKKLSSSRPYFIRAVYEWLVDCEEIPQIMCDTKVPGCEVPQEHVKNNRIVFNVGPLAVRELEITNEYVTFSASFSQEVQDVIIPVAAVMAIFARDSNEGMFFGEDDPGGPPELPENPANIKKKKPYLRIVKSDRDQSNDDK